MPNHFYRQIVPVTTCRLQSTHHAACSLVHGYPQSMITRDRLTHALFHSRSAAPGNPHGRIPRSLATACDHHSLGHPQLFIATTTIGCRPKALPRSLLQQSLYSDTGMFTHSPNHFFLSYSLVIFFFFFIYPVTFAATKATFGAGDEFCVLIDKQNKKFHQ